MLRTRQLIPPLTLRDLQGHETRAWDFKQKKNLVIAFLHMDCAACERFLRILIEHARELQGQEAVVLLALPQQPSSPLVATLPPGIIAGVDAGSRGARAFLDGGAQSAGAGGGLGLFVTDRYGEVSARWPVTEHQFPGIDEVLSALNSVQIACEECYVPHWPVEE